MSDDENLWKWNKFVEIGNKIHKMRGVERTEVAQDALLFAKVLRRTEFLVSSKERYELYECLLPKIAEYLDGNAELIQSTVEKYFLLEHCKAGNDEKDFDISFSPKLTARVRDTNKSGVQTGFICTIFKFSGTQKTRYFIKTLQNGPTKDNIKSIKYPDTKEIFIYNLLHSLGMGPEVHFIIPFHGTKRTLYIATKEVAIKLLSHLTLETFDSKALIQLDLVSRILCLRDCTTNGSNCGQVENKPMIIDFHIENQSNGYYKTDILDGFYLGNSEFNYLGLMKTATSLARDEKLEILKQSLKEWNLIQKIDRAKLEIDQLVRDSQDKMTFENDLALYVENIKKTIESLAGK